MFDLYDYGGASGARVDKIIGPKGKGGRLVDYGVMNIQEDFAGSSTDATIAVGNASDPDAYGNELSLDEAVDAVDGGYTLQSAFAVADQAANEGVTGFNLPADTAIYVTSTEGTGTPTGQACPYVVIDWAW
jgi:hypothetical protein